MSRIFAAVMTLAASAAFASDPIELSLDEYKMYRHWQNAMQDPRVQKMKPAARNPAIAKDARYKLKDMEKAIEKGEGAGDLKAKCEALLKDSLGQSPAKDLIRKLEVDATEPHAVAYIEWANDSIANVEEEASLVASQTKSCPILSSVQVWATDKANPKSRVFQALISASAASKINPERVKDFADTRYMRLFEKVKNVANGDDLSAEQAKN